MTMAHCMLDLETLSSASDAAIVAIGAVMFDLTSGSVYDNKKSGMTFYKVINAKSAQKAGGRIDAETVMWWLQQSPEAQNALTSDPGLPIEVALQEFSKWVRGVTCSGMWGNGADFDNVILCNAYTRLGYTPPWSHKMNRCYRTMKGLIGEGVEFVREGTHHNALDDAISQAKHLCKIWKRVKVV